MVYLVGAGPGDPGLITVRGMACLEQADVVIYDRLVNQELLANTKPGAELILKQDLGGQGEVNRTLAERAAAGEMVVRLKGGDPFLFGRGGEEAEYLAACGLSFAVVPGVSSALAVPAYAGIPLTHRHHSATVGIVTGHEASPKDGPGVNWAELSHTVDTLVILMGLGNLPFIVERLLASHMNADTPVAVISQGTLPVQETLISTLGEVAEQVQRCGLRSPAVVVVSEVVRFRESISWFEESAQGPEER